MATVRAILVDIEGTTSSISFVKDVLFPYARERLPAFVTTHSDRPEVQHWLHEAAKEAGLVAASEHEIIELLIGWIDADRKSTALKALQGMIWADGYREREFHAHIYPDAARCLRAWHARQKLHVFPRAGSTQKLLFANTEAGDLSDVFSGYFAPKPDRSARVARTHALPRKSASRRRRSCPFGHYESSMPACRGHADDADRAWPGRCPADATHPCVGDFDAIAIDAR